MKFHFENLGLLDQVDIELADLTLICGENNTGKTYATYAVYGFLRNWRQMLRSSLKAEIDALLKHENEYRLDLQQMFAGKVNDYLARLGKSYISMLPQVFAADARLFEKTKCVPISTQEDDFSSELYQKRVQAGPDGKVLATITKDKGSAILEVLVTDAVVLQRPFGLTEFIADAISDIVFAPHLPSVYISSAERTGAAIFRKELDMARTRMLKAINQIDSTELKRNPFKIFQNVDAGYAWPVEDNVEFVRQLENIDKRSGDLVDANPDLLEAFNAIIGGSYKVVSAKLVFQTKGNGNQRFTMNEASSSIRALLDVGFYLRCKAQVGDLFIIDEPELNLHPKNQRAFARLVSRMVNAGIKIFITTHSDYLIKELNTLIMLNQRTDHTQSIQRRYNYEDAELIDPKRVRLYMTATTNKPAAGSGRRGKIRYLKLAKIDSDYGIEVKTFDDTIEDMNTIQSEILYGGEL